MDRCPKQPAWSAYFRENMEALGLDVPHSLFGKAAMTTTYLGAIVALAEKMGPRVTVREVITAGTKTEWGMVAAAGYASWYFGAAVGSAAVATGRHLACGTQIIDVIGYAARNRMLSPAITRQLVAHPEIYDIARKNRRAYSHLAWALS